MREEGGRGRCEGGGEEAREGGRRGRRGRVRREGGGEEVREEGERRGR